MFEVLFLFDLIIDISVLKEDFGTADVVKE